MERAGHAASASACIKSVFDVNKHIEPKHILNVMAKHPDLFSDLPAIPADVAVKPGYVFKP